MLLCEIWRRTTRFKGGPSLSAWLGKGSEGGYIAGDYG